MPRLKGLRKRGRCYYFRVRDRNKEKLIPLGRDFDRAVTRVLELRKRIEAGRPLTDEGPALTVAAAAKEWLEAYVKHNRWQRYQRDTQKRMDRYLIPFMGKERLEDVTARTLYAYRNYLSQQKHWRTGKPLAPATVRHALGDLRAMLNFCLNVGLLDRSPIPTRGWMPRIPERAPDTLSREECAALRGLPDPHGFVLRFLLGSGLRWGEMVRAQASDIRDGVLLVRKSKSGKVRRVPLPEEVLAECRDRVGRLCPMTDSVSFNRRVRELVADNLKTLDEESKKPLENLERFHAHLTRHTYASEWREAGGSLAGLQAVLGHSSVTVTERYGTISDDLVQREARRLEAHRMAGGG
jgi:integrase